MVVLSKQISAGKFMNIFQRLIYLPLFILCLPVFAQAPLIMVDQFGYRPADEKIAVLADPVAGFNAGQDYIPCESLQVKRLIDNTVVFTGSPVTWKNGMIQESSGDRGWWFDFSAVTDPGHYYIFDERNQTSSYPFIISGNVYTDLLKAAP